LRGAEVWNCDVARSRGCACLKMAEAVVGVTSRRDAGRRDDAIAKEVGRLLRMMRGGRKDKKV